MSNRRRLLQFLGLGMASGVLTANQARAAAGKEPVSKTFFPDDVPEWARPEFPPYARTMWRHRVVLFDTCDPKLGWPKKHWSTVLGEFLDREDRDGWEFVSMNHYLEREIVLRKRVLWEA